MGEKQELSNIDKLTAITSKLESKIKELEGVKRGLEQEKAELQDDYIDIVLEDDTDRLNRYESIGEEIKSVANQLNRLRAELENNQEIKRLADRVVLDIKKELPKLNEIEQKQNKELKALEQEYTKRKAEIQGKYKGELKKVFREQIEPKEKAFKYLGNNKHKAIRINLTSRRRRYKTI